MYNIYIITHSVYLCAKHNFKRSENAKRVSTRVYDDNNNNNYYRYNNNIVLLYE